MAGPWRVVAKLVIYRQIFCNRSYFGKILSDIGIYLTKLMKENSWIYSIFCFVHKFPSLKYVYLIAKWWKVHDPQVSISIVQFELIVWVTSISFLRLSNFPSIDDDFSFKVGIFVLKIFTFFVLIFWLC